MAKRKSNKVRSSTSVRSNRKPAPKPGPKVVSASELLGNSVALLKSDGLTAAISEIERCAARLGATNLPMGQLLLGLAKLVLDHHPKLALDVCLYVQELPDAPIEATLVAGSLQDRLGDRSACQASMRSVIDADGAAPMQKLRAANLLVRFGEQEVALEAARAAFDAMGRPIEHAAILLYIAQVTADWALVDELTAQLRVGYADGQLDKINESPRTHLLWCDDEALNLKVMHLWSRRNLPGPIAPQPKVQPLAGRRLRVGYLSSDLREHPMARLMLGVFRNHDRAEIELFMYCSGWDDGSKIRKNVVAQFDHVHSVAHLSDEAAAQLIRSHEIDVLVELNGPTRAHRMGILRHRPAPVQIDYLGLPGSVGGRVVDYIIGDLYTVPEGAQRNYAEKILRIFPSYYPNDHSTYSLLPVPSREQVGLPSDPNLKILGMFNAINKVHQEVWDTWMEIMHALPDTVLWILDPGPAARRFIARAAQSAGVPLKRILASPKLPQAQHLARIQCCDLMLDPWPYGGHTSTVDALYAGVPVIAMEGANFASRVSTSLLQIAGLGELVCKTRRQYVKRAVELLEDPTALRNLQAHLTSAGRQGPLFQSSSMTRQLEQAYKTAFSRCASGLPPDHITLAPNEVQNERPAQENSFDVFGHHNTSVVDLGDANNSKILHQNSLRTNLTPDQDAKIPLVLVCGPWSSGTSAVAGMLANAGLQAPGPYVTVNDPRTAHTYEMKAFQTMLRQLVSEGTLQRSTSSETVLNSLRQFRDDILLSSIRNLPDAPSVMLKHGLATLFLPEICSVFDVRIVGVLRPLEAIEATRVRRNWWPSLGENGAKVVYRALFDHLVNADTPFHLVRYPDLLSQPGVEFDKLMAFCNLEPTYIQRQTALAFVDRRPRQTQN